jgi:cytidylate kinase
VTLVTISATYGSGGSEVAPALAERLGVPFVDRVIPTQVASRLAVPLAHALAHDETCGGRLARLLGSLAPTGLALGTHGPVDQPASERDFLVATEQVLFERAESGRGVILGRAAAVVDGPREKRVRQGMRIQNIDRPTAERVMGETDRARHAYVRHFYRADATDPDLYHLVIDSTEIPLSACVEVIAQAAESRDRRPAPAAA